MRRLVLSLVLVGMVTTVASAQLTLFYDVRQKADIVTPKAPYLASDSLCRYVSVGYGQNYPLHNAGHEGDGQQVWVSPYMKDFTDYTGFGGPDSRPESMHSFYDGVDYAQADFYLYAKYAGPTDYVVSSIGVTQEVVQGAAAFTQSSPGKFYIGSLTTTVANNTLWDGYNFVGSNASTKLKEVQVPVTGTSTPAYDAGAGIGPGYFDKIATLHVQGGPMDYGKVPHAANYGLKLKVNELLCTQVTRPPASAPALVVKFGYWLNGSTWEAETASGTGSVENATTTTEDMVITVIQKGDFDFNGLACNSYDDLAYYDIALFYSSTLKNCNPYEMWLADFDNNGIPANSNDDFEYYKHAAFPAGPPL